MKILFIGTYDPKYSRNRVLLRGFRENKIDVIECNGGLNGVSKYLRLIREYWKIKEKFDLVLVTFPAQEVVLLIKFLLWKQRAPILVDLLTSHYDGYILDRGKYGKKSLHAYWYRFLDRLSITLSDYTLVDTNEYASWYEKEYKVPSKKLITVYIGSDDSVFYPNYRDKENDKFLIHFHGNFIPLQGVEYIVGAADKLKNEDVQFLILGRGQDYRLCRNLAEEKKLSNITWVDRVEYQELASFINRADVCLGAFGDTGKFQRVVPNKVYEYMACSKPVISGMSTAGCEVLIDGKNSILCRFGDSKDLAEKILLLKNNINLRNQISNQARRDFLNQYSPKQLVAKLIRRIV